MQFGKNERQLMKIKNGLGCVQYAFKGQMVEQSGNDFTLYCFLKRQKKPF